MSSDPADLLRQRGIQVTAQRLAVMRAVASQPHISADGISDVVRQEIGTISRQSVYDTLAVLVELGLIRRIQPVGSAARFEDRVNDNHHHLVCRDCGNVAHAPGEVFAGLRARLAADYGFAADLDGLTIPGRCRECAATDLA